ncbi:hypothetical protein SAMN02787144_102627 [Streptomyces atratus]|uniref:Uncharacterized protein n=2 Tax=Streptomyces atratus TaxID=1893 RepID=A0A1K2F0H6_STRAR|nr:hypothetical protein [Streptomyces atratus]SFY40938.1 hypothetical protein SAMN02787144_102627 [Streptomyces atratus]
MIETVQRFFGARPESVGQAREFASETLAVWGLSERIDDIRLCRGLVLVAALADEWGVQDRTPLGKIVWSCFKTAGGTTA